MVSEVVSYLNIQPAGIYFDGTVGLGGHTESIVNNLSKKGQLIGVDIDEYMVNLCHQRFKPIPDNLILEQAAYDSIDKVLQSHSIKSLDGILLDLGLSSVHLDAIDRGFSFQSENALDMRFSKDIQYNAAELISKSSAPQLKEIFWNFGEERYAGPIARAIKEADKIETVNDLKRVVGAITPQRFLNRTLARIFQALRIAVNNELQRLKDFLAKCIRTLNVGGRLIIISYHSLEDRIVKQAFRGFHEQGNFKILTKKPIRPSQAEIEINRRSQSAKLRVGERIN